jgi:putative SOS response-associated peptidase YedK
MTAYFEPNYESGKAERWSIGMADGEPFAVAGLYREWEQADGRKTFSFTQITINADSHPVMNRFHKPDDEKRSLVVIAPERYDDWLNCRNPELARAFLLPYPPELFRVGAVVKAAPVMENRELF